MSPQKIASIVMLVSLMLSAGMEINREHLIAALKDFGLIGRALLANFVLVPLFGVGLARLFHLEGDIAVGFLLMAIAPGVPFLVRAAGRQPGGSLGLAAALAFIMPALSIITIPLTAPLVLPPDADAHVPGLQLAMTLILFQLVPLLIGLAIADRAPALAEKLKRPLTLLFFVAIAALLVLIGPALIKAVSSVYGTHALLAMLVIVLLCVASGWIFGGPQDANRRTLSIATALRNIGTCAVIATASFADTLVGPTVLTYFLVQFILTIILRIYFGRTAAPAAPA
ncbi:MAG TPA: bile acid:sodium symporter [Candidatus Eremiobacteraceae bacterium]|nr:bile acid:sodium symporter [Candidatus Eremiobacteraceae bacterium]